MNLMIGKSRSVTLPPAYPYIVLLAAAYDGQRLVGAVACRLEKQPNGVAQLYIMTLGVYAAYRDQKIGNLASRLRGPSYFGRDDVSKLRVFHS